MKYFIADAFILEETAFSGNPAGVCVLDEWPEKQLMQSIASQNNLSETAFVVKNGEGYGIRWFTPRSEVDLCGHATLASAFIIMHYAEPNLNEICLNSQSGVLTVRKNNDLYTLDFPSRKPVTVDISPIMEEAVGARILEAHGSRDLILLLESEKAVRDIAPDMRAIEQIPGYLGICVTARGHIADFVSRYFAPLEGIPEDPVTGSAHCSLIPFWAERLNKKTMTALQLSQRGGRLHVTDHSETGRVDVAGRARIYLEGEIKGLL